MLPNPESCRVSVLGKVQGVGFRPYVYRLAKSLSLSGEVRNSTSGVSILLRGAPGDISRFVDCLSLDSPGEIEHLVIDNEASVEASDFSIAVSTISEGIADALLPDRAICADCRHEFSNPQNRRFQFPLISCSACGPRFSICEALPYDRENTSWRDFPLCEKCQLEFDDPADRRFHTVGISCPDCGPEFHTNTGEHGANALDRVIATLDAGGIAAVKGMSGFQLMVDATNLEAVNRLRRKKNRRKPFAVMMPDIECLRAHLTPSGEEIAALRDSSAPIVLMQCESVLQEVVAPGSGMLAAMLPNSGVQLCLANSLQRPLVATSGNVSGSPLHYENEAACAQLGRIADVVLFHHLELRQGIDDTIVRIMNGRPVVLRLGRGVAPYVGQLPEARNVTGCGAHLKTNISLGHSGKIIAGPYVGDLTSAETRQRYRQQKKSLPAFFNTGESDDITDLHPDYGSTVDADYRSRSIPHHIAHAMAVWFECQPEPPFLVLTWDGNGLGPDDTIWGGECIYFDAGMRWSRVASIVPFQLPGAENIARYPGRVAGALLGNVTSDAISCTSMGRLIEGFAALAGLRSKNNFEAQAAIEWEAAAWRASKIHHMDLELCGMDIDWRGLVPLMLDHSVPLQEKALGFHVAIARAALLQCQQFEVSCVLITGGVFQNRLLVELLTREFESAGISVGMHSRLPPNDGSISLGQCVAASLGVSPRDSAELCA